VPRWNLTLIIVLCTHLAFAQGPVRDARAGAATGAIRGRVLTGDGFPARQAEVLLSSADVNRPPTVSTDNEGRFSFESVPPGRYALMARKPGYLPFGYGQKSYMGPLEPVSVGAGEEIATLEIVLPRGSAITGRVTNEYGEPVLRATVSAMRFGYTPTGQQTLQLGRSVDGSNPNGIVQLSGSRAVTDDLGQFRLFGLEPGEYIVSAVATDPMQGRVISFGPNAAAGLAAASAPTFYPGVSDPADAMAIRLGVAEDTTIHLQLVPGREAHVAGTVFDARGRPAAYGLRVTLRPRSPLASGAARTTNVRDGGEFSFDDVPSGEYTLLVSPFPSGDAYPKPPGGPEFASMPVSIDGNDIADLRLTTRLAATVSGRVVFDGPPPASLRTIDVQAVPASPQDAGLRFRVNRDANEGVRSDGSFELPGLVGLLSLQVSPGNGYMVRSISVNGADVTDALFDPTTLGGTVEARVVLTDKITVVSGTLPSDRMNLVGGAILIVADALPHGTLPARYMRVVRPDPTGHFEVRGLPPGHYSTALIGFIEDTAVFDPLVQARVRQSGRAFSLRAGERLTIDLPAASGW